jgi:chloramphenicol 3-O-phosphotransferase
LKRQCIDEDDFIWLKQEIDDIRERLVQIADHQAGVDAKLEEIMRQVQRFNEI